MKQLLARPLKNTLIAIGIAVLFFIPSSLITFYYARVANAPIDTASCSHCVRGLLENEAILNKLSTDFYTLSGYFIEMGIVLLIAQIVYRVVRRVKRSR